MGTNDDNNKGDKQAAEPLSASSIAAAKKEAVEAERARVEGITQSTAVWDEGYSRLAVASRYIGASVKGAAKTMAAVRPMAYASEVGESFRPVAHPWFVRGMYGLSFLYVGSDVSLKVMNRKDPLERFLLALDQTMWHSLGSLALPALVIHKIVNRTDQLLVPKIQSKALMPYARYLPLAMGLSSIPFIIHPIDTFTDYFMNYSFRILYDDYLDLPHHG